jgi:hypothetical protein
MFIPSVIKSIQRGSVDLTGVSTNTTAITAVDLTASVLKYLNYNTPFQGAINEGRKSINYKPRLFFSSATAVGAIKGNASSVATVYFEVIEFYPAFIKSIQRGVITTAGGSGSTAITSVNTAKTMVDWLGSDDDCDTLDDVPNGCEVALSLTSSILLSALMTSTPPVHTVNSGYQVTEFR